MTTADYLHYGDHGDRVRRLQSMLNNNRYFKPRTPLEVDGKMGTRTCSCVFQAKYRMGYAKEDLKPIAGPTFFSYISEKVPLPPLYRHRRQVRLAKLEAARSTTSPTSVMRKKVFAAAKEEIGTHEHGYNNIKYNDWWGWGSQPYCAIGISWLWVVKGGSTAFKRQSRWAGTDPMLSDAQNGRNGIHLTNDPLPGAPGVIDFEGHSDPDHALTFVKDNGNGTCETIEFNTSGPNGEGVWRKDRPLRNCWFFHVER